MSKNLKKNETQRHRAKAGMAILPALALTMGTFSMAPMFMGGGVAQASTFTGGLRGSDGSGVIERQDQMTSDLPAGECVVSGDNNPEGSQAGFSWNNAEPNAESPNRTKWGFQLAFDNSQDRTFSHWGFTNSGNMGDYLNTGEIPSLDVGKILAEEDAFRPVTHKADENIEITGYRTQRNLNTYSNLTEEKVRQFSQGTKDNPVVYAWTGNYTRDSRNAKNRATAGENSSYVATVNPWPSENANCSPITVNWESFSKHVIIPGEKTKIGHINIPETIGAEGGDFTDDSLSRMVVEAYDGNGEFVGTSNSAKSGGIQNVEIDANGDIYFTWPEYRGTALADDKNISFSLLALPRSVGELQGIAETYNPDWNEDGTGGKAFDESNGLKRYNTPNVIDSKAFSLDDTEYHNPKYDKTDASIISGVSSETKKVTDEAQSVTFTQVPELLKNLEKSRENGGFEARVSLDEKYVFEGWKAEIDENHNVTVTAPKNPKPGSFAQVKVVAEYSNGSTDVISLMVVVDPNHTQITDLVRPGLTKGKINEELYAQIGNKSIMNGHSPVNPASFEVDPDSVPDGWKVTVDDTGRVTAVADDTISPGDVITPKFKATYPDGTTDPIEAQFQAIVDIKIPTYDTVTNKPDAEVTLTPEIPERGLSGNTSDESPKKYTFKDGSNKTTVTDDAGTWVLTLDEENGVISTTIPKTAPEGHILNVPVLAYYDNTEHPQEVVGTVVVIKGEIAPLYDVLVTGPGDTVQHQVSNVPEGSTYSFGKDDSGAPILTQTTPDGWKYEINPNSGVVSSTPPKTAKPGDKSTVTVRVVAPGGESAETPVTTVVKLSENWQADPSYGVKTVQPGKSADLPVSLELAEGVKLADSNPFQISPDSVPDGWTATVNDDGTVSATAPKTAKPGDKVEIPVIVTYSDGSQDTTKAVVTVEDFPTRDVPFKVVYNYDDTLDAGTYQVDSKGALGKEKQDANGDWVQTVEPVDEIVRIGTKSAESAKSVTFNLPIPYPTEIRENPELDPGVIRVVQEGENGSSTYTADFTAVGDKATVVEGTKSVAPKPRIVEYGPKRDFEDLTSKKTVPVPFKIEYVLDDTLEAGKQVVDIEGQMGENLITSTQKFKDGKPDGEPNIEITETRAPVDGKIRIGTKTAGEVSKTVETVIPYETKVVFDPSLAPGVKEVRQKGETGVKTGAWTQKIENSQPVGQSEIVWNTTKEPVEEIVAVGSKSLESSGKVEWSAQIPFDVTTRPNPELKPGEIKVAQKGVPGEKTFKADFKAVGKNATVEPSETVTKQPIPEIIEYGPGLEDSEITTKTEKPVPNKTVIKFDDSLKAGEQVVDEEGENGVEIVTSTQKLVDGKPAGDPTVSTERVKEPKDRIVRVGTKTTGEDVSHYEIPVPFDTEIIFDDSMEAGTQEVVREGTLGKDKVTTTRTIENSVVTDTQSGQERILEPVNRIVKIGTKNAPAGKQVKWSEKVPFGTQVRINPDLKPGETRIVKDGVLGEDLRTLNISYIDGEFQDGETTTERVREPEDQIIEVGPAKGVKTDLSRVHVEKTPYDTLIEFDPELEAGQMVEDQKGDFGEKEITTSWNLVDGVPVGDPEISEKTLKDPQPRKLRVGSKCLCVDPTKPEVTDPTETEETTDPTETEETTEPTETEEPSETTETTETEETTESTETEETTEPTETTETEPSQAEKPSKTDPTKPAPSKAKSAKNGGLASSGIDTGGKITIMSILALLGSSVALLFNRRKGGQTEKTKHLKK